MEKGSEIIKKRLLVLVGVAYLFIGGVVLFNSFQGITGFVVYEGSDVEWGWFLGFVFVVIGVLVLMASNREKRQHRNLEKMVNEGYKEFRKRLEKGDLRELKKHFPEREGEFTDYFIEINKLKSEKRDEYARGRLSELLGIETPSENDNVSKYDQIASRIYESLAKEHAYGHHTRAGEKIEKAGSGGDITTADVKEVLKKETELGHLNKDHTSYSVTRNRKMVGEIIDKYGEYMDEGARKELEELRKGKMPQGVR